MQRAAVRWLAIGALALILFGLLAANVYVTYRVFTSRNPGGNDFYSRWVGGRALIYDGLNPYSDAVTLRIQKGMYGRPARPDEDQVAFAYPLYSLLFFWPLCLVSNYALVQAAWIWLLLIALAVAVIVAMDIIGWRPPPALRVLTIAWAVVLYHSVRAYMLGQLGVLVVVCLVAALWAMRRGHDGWAGLLLALATIKPQMVYLAIPWVLIWAAGQRRWRIWWGFGVSMVVLVAGFSVILPSWLPDFVRQSLLYPSYTVYGSLTWMIVQYWLGLGQPAEIAAQVVLACAALALAWLLRRATWEGMFWLLGVLLLLTNFLTPRIATTNYLALLPWAVWGFQRMQIAWGRRGAWLAVALQAASVLGLWALFLATIEGNFETAPIYYPFPAAVAVLLVWLWTQIGAAARRPAPGRPIRQPPLGPAATADTG